MKNLKNNTKRLDGKKILVALTKRLEIDMRSYIRDKGIESENELVRQAIGMFIYKDYQDETLKLQGLKKHQEQIKELKDMIEVLFSYIKLMHVNTLAYHPVIDINYADAAFASANDRHDKFFNFFQDTLKDNPPLFEQLLHKYYSDLGKPDGKN